MKISFPLGSYRTHAQRVLVFVLLVGIVYSVTFSSGHSHETLSSRAYTNGTVTAAEQPGSSFLVATQSPSHRQGCLICLFHQQLFSSVVHAPLYIVKPSIHAASVSSPRVPFYARLFTSTLAAPLSGRAPPIC